MDEAEQDVPAYIIFPAVHRAIKPIERLNGEIKQRTEVVGILPNEAAIARLSARSHSNKERMSPAARPLYDIARGAKT